MSATSVQYQDDEKQAMARAAVTLLARWGVSDVMAKSLLDGASIERTERTAVLLGIHAALRQIFPDGDRAARWVGATNAAFDGKSALDVMQAGGNAGMQRVKHYLDAESPVERTVPNGTRTTKIECGLWRTQNRLRRQKSAGQPARFRLFKFPHSHEQNRTALDGRALGFARWDKLWEKPVPPPKFNFKIMFLHDFFGYHPLRQVLVHILIQWALPAAQRFCLAGRIIRADGFNGIAQLLFTARIFCPN